ncbi:PKD domain-containing protein [Phocaeicola dorei]|nr:PKD domain-containing protein [Phocaeicola dorei]
MGKIYTRKILFVIAAMLLCILVAILIRLFFSSRTVRMTLTPIEVETGETVHYADSTRNARSWLWEFGNGDISHERSGEYVFKKPGRYQVRLQVDGGLERKQIITVHRSRDDYGSDELVRMKAHKQPPFKEKSYLSKDTVRRKNGAGSSENPELSIRGSRIHSTPIQNPAYTRFC